MTLREGDVIVGVDGKRWQVSKIDAYVWKRRPSYHHWYNAIRLIRLEDQRAFWVTRQWMCQMFGGYNARSKA